MPLNPLVRDDMLRITLVNHLTYGTAGYMRRARAGVGLKVVSQTTGGGASGFTEWANHIGAAMHFRVKVLIGLSESRVRSGHSEGPTASFTATCRRLNPPLPRGRGRLSSKLWI